MTRSFYILIFIFLLKTIFGQTETGLKDRLIYSTITNVFSSTKYSNGMKTSGRHTQIDFSIGENGVVKNIGKNGENLYDALNSDSAAIRELDLAYKFLKKKRVANTLEYVTLIIGISSFAPLALGANNDEKPPVNAASVSGGIGVLVGFIGANYFFKKTDKYYDKFVETIKNSIDIYNNNLKTKHEKN